MNWIRRKFAWAKQNPLFWLNILLAVITLLVVKIWQWPESVGLATDFVFRLWGMLLQFVGVLTVWLDLVGSARKFGKGRLFANTWIWLRSFFSSGVVVGAVGASLSLMSGRARGTVRRKLDPNDSVERRLAALEANIAYIDADLSSAYREIDQRATQLNKKVEEIQDKNNQSINELKTSLEDAAVGNFTKLVFGVVWLAIGTMISTLAPELVLILKGG